MVLFMVFVGPVKSGTRFLLEGALVDDLAETSGQELAVDRRVLW